MRLQSSQNMLDWLANEVQKQQTKVRGQRTGAGDYRDKQNAMSLDDKQNIVSRRLTS